MKNEKLWENIGYVNLALCLFGQITVGWFYMVAQSAYLLANGIGVARSFILKRPTADKVKDTAFFAITLALIVIRMWGGR